MSKAALIGLKRGTPVRVLSEYSETGRVVRHETITGYYDKTKVEHWYHVRYDRDGARVLVHRDMLAVRNVSA